MKAISCLLRKAGLDSPPCEPETARTSCQPSSPAGRLYANRPGFLLFDPEIHGCSKRGKNTGLAYARCGQIIHKVNEVTQTFSKHQDIQVLDAWTAGALSAPTSGERAARIREWLATQPNSEQMQEVYRQLSIRDKGAARPLREKLDEFRRIREQETIGTEWAAKAQALLAATRFNIADAMAWQRDAAKAGAALSRVPLLELKEQLIQQIKVVEDLQHRVQVLREVAVLLAQRIDVLSTKSWLEAQAARDTLHADIRNWQERMAHIQAEDGWSSMDLKLPPLLEASGKQLQSVWEAFEGALTQAVRAAADKTATLPAVPVWADELRQGRVMPVAPSGIQAKTPIDPELRARAVALVQDLLGKLEQELAQGHGKASVSVAAALRNALREHERIINDQLEGQSRAALAAAEELEGWQRWRADQLREELVIKAEGLTKRPEGQSLGGRKMQETLRGLREQWKQTDQGGVPNHALWKRFDDACNRAHKVVELWIEKAKAETARHKAERMALIEEVQSWAAANQEAPEGDWKTFARTIHQFSERWRQAGHLAEKPFAELQSRWKAAIHAAALPLEVAQQKSLQSRQAMIEEAVLLGGAPVLRIDAVKDLQKRWQMEVHAVPLDRRQEQKLWEAFRKPIDEAFARKEADRDKAVVAISERDRSVLEAAKALEAATRNGDAQQIRLAMGALDERLRSPESSTQAASSEQQAQAIKKDNPQETLQASAGEVKSMAKPVRAVRGDDRPGMRKTETVPVRSRSDHERRGSQDSRASGARPRGTEGMPPRLGDAAFRAQRDAMEHAQAILKKLANQAHGEVLTRLLEAWERRDVNLLPGAQELGRQVTPAVRALWAKALTDAVTVSGEMSTALLRLEMAAEIPTPAAELPARRALQLQLLTRRNDPAPAQTWGQDVACVIAGGFEPVQARRVQQALKVLLRH